MPSKIFLKAKELSIERRRQMENTMFDDIEFIETDAELLALSSYVNIV